MARGSGVARAGVCHQHPSVQHPHCSSPPAAAHWAPAQHHCIQVTPCKLGLILTHLRQALPPRRAWVPWALQSMCATAQQCSPLWLHPLCLPCHRSPRSRSGSAWKAFGKGFGRQQSTGPLGQEPPEPLQLHRFPQSGLMQELLVPGETLSGSHSSWVAPWGAYTRRAACPRGCPPLCTLPIPAAQGRKRRFLPEGSNGACVRARNSSRPAHPKGHLINPAPWVPVLAKG